MRPSISISVGGSHFIVVVKAEKKLFSLLQLLPPSLAAPLTQQAPKKPRERKENTLSRAQAGSSTGIKNTRARARILLSNHRPPTLNSH
jgi:hypothetical protein